MNLDRRLVGLGLIGVAAAATGGVVAFRQVPQVRDALGDRVRLTGYASPELLPLLASPKLATRFASRGLDVIPTAAGSVAMVRDPNLLRSGPDFLFPGSLSLYGVARGAARVLTHRALFTSPLVIYSWKPIADALVRAGVAASAGEAYTVDTAALIEAILAGRSWAELGWEGVWGAPRLISSDPKTASGGYMLAGLAASALIGGVATQAKLPAVLPRVKALLSGMGYKPASDAQVFDGYVAGGPGAAPLVVGFEHQLVERFAAEPGRWLQTVASAGAAKPVVLYPKPTVLADATLMLLKEEARPLLEILSSAPVQAIAANDHGFRGPAGAAPALPRRLEVTAPPAADSPMIAMPEGAVMLRILGAL